MSLNVSLNQNINRGIDSTALREVTQEIFKRAGSKTADFSSLDLTKFRRADIGMDLYSGKVDSTLAKQVAMANSGMQIQLSEKVATALNFLNNEASKSVMKNVEGKMTIDVKEEVKNTKNVFQLPGFSKLVKISDTAKDKTGSNPFYKGELLKSAKKEEESVEEGLNIFA